MTVEPAAASRPTSNAPFDQVSAGRVRKAAIVPILDANPAHRPTMRLMQTIDAPRLPLSALSDDERLFYDRMYEFAYREVRPLARQMDEQAKIPRALIDRLFELGVMGIEIPESLGGGGAPFFHSVF